MEKQISGTITVEYDPEQIKPSIAKDIVDIAYHESLSYPRDLFYNIAYPHVTFYLTKYNEEIGYKIIFCGYGHVPDPYLKYIRSFHKKLVANQYKVSVIFLTKNGKLTFEYSDRNFWVELLKNNLFVILLLPWVTILSLIISKYLYTLIVPKVNNELLLSLIEQLLPLISYPVSLVAFKLQPLIPLTKLFYIVVIITTVFLYYLSTGTGLLGSLLLIILYILNSIQSSL